MDKKKPEPYRLRGDWYEEGFFERATTIELDLGSGKIATATVSAEKKFSELIMLARRVVGKEGGGREREDLSHILALILFAQARRESEDETSVAAVIKSVMQKGAELLHVQGVFSAPEYRMQIGAAFPASGKNPPWKKPLLRRLVPYLKKEAPASGELPWIDVDGWVKACERLGQHAINRDMDAINLLLAETIPANGFYRPVKQLPDPQGIEDLADEFPNFTEVVGFYAEQAAISKISGKGRVRLPPVLLLGPPGVGKTVFSMALAERLGVAQFAVSFSGLSNAGVLSGLSGYWGNGRQGQVFDSLLQGNHMNPVFLLDEIDKSAGSGSHRNPQAPLHQLLEMENAKVFIDEFVEIPIDTSWFTWICTANDAEEIPLSLRSRLTTFDVEPPTHEQLWVIGERQYRRTIQEYGLSGKLPADPPAGVLEKIVGSPREMGLALRRLIGRMARDFAAGREIQIERLLEQEKVRTGKPRVGFI